MICPFAHGSIGNVEIAEDVNRNRPNYESNNFLKGVYE